MKKFSILAAVAVVLSVGVAAAAPAHSDVLKRCVIEDAENGNPQTYYNEKPKILEQTTERASEGKKSLHFITGTGFGAGYFTRSHWDKPENFSLIAENGIISFDLWVNNPEDVQDPNAGNLFEFNIGSSNTDNYVVWYIPSGLLKAKTWNRVVLRLSCGQPVLAGSTVNGKPMSSGKDASVEHGNVDWKSVDNDRLALYCDKKPIEGYLDNVVAEAISDSLPVPQVSATLSAIDPDSHYLEAKKISVANAFWPKYDIIPPDVRKDAFFDGDILQWDKDEPWKATFENCSNPNFCLSYDQAIRGKKNAKLEFNVDRADARVILTPPSPIEIDKDFNAVEFWIYGRYNTGTTFSLKFQESDGSIYRYSCGTRTFEGPGVLFNNWTLGHVTFPRMFAKGAKLLSIEFAPKGTGFRLIHIDEMRVLNYKDYLKNTPAPKFEHTGDAVKLPVSPNGACPTTVGAVNTAVAIADKTGYLHYTTDKDDVCYIYTPSTGTFSDFSVSVKGKTSFRPLVDGSPEFVFNEKNYDMKSGDVKAKCISAKKSGKALVYVWRYTTPGGSCDITYKYSLKGKTLQVQASSEKRCVSSIGLGYADGLTDPKVIQVPMMTRAPGILCNDGIFTTCYVDWYKGNFSKLSFSSENDVKDGKAYYTYDAPSIIYLPKTNGVRWPLNETFYLTTSSNVDDCLVNISNPPSPNKDVIANRLYRLMSPVDFKPSDTCKSWVAASRSLAELYDKYGMNNLIMMFHAGVWTNCGAHGPEPFNSRLKTSVATEGGDAAIVGLFSYLKTLGMYPGYYGGCAFWQPHSIIWDANKVALKSDANWEPTWSQAYHMKPWFFAETTNTFYKKQVEKFGGESVYEDGWTSGDLWEYNDYDERIPSSGRFIDTLQAVATGYRNERKTVGGPVFSEGDGCCFYTAGLNDGDYGKLFGYANGKRPNVRKPILLVDFELRKVAPLHAPVSFDLGYWGYDGARDLTCGDYKYLHHFIATQIAFGTIGSMEPYASIYGDPAWKFDSVITSYFMMQQIQKRYIMQTVDKIEYFDGEKLQNSSDALRSGIYNNNMLRITYKNGLVIYVNSNWDNKSWTITDAGKTYELPSGGWYAKQGDNFVEYSATVDGRRVDFVDSPEYTFLNGNGKEISLAGITTSKIAISHKVGKHKGELLTWPEK